jgi:copper transport protein
MRRMASAGGETRGSAASSRRRAVARWLVVGILGLLVVGLTAAPAAAHTDLESSTPAAGATVERLTSIDLRFSQGLEPSASHVWLRDAAGYLELGPATAPDGPSSLSVPVPALGNGTYDVVWHVVASDGTPVEGTFTFTLAAAAPAAPAGAAPAPPQDPAADAPPDTSLAIVVPAGPRTSTIPSLAEHGHGPGGLTTALAHGVLDASLATLVGGLAFVSGVWPAAARLRRARQVLWIAALLGVLASFELAAFQHAGATGLSTAEAFSPAHQLDALQFRFGQVAAVRIVLLLAAAGLTARLARDGARAARSVTWCAAACAVALGLAETLVLLGHSSSPGLVATGARVLHVLGVSLWIGGLVMLLVVVLPRRRVDELVAVLPRFSHLATVAVGVLTVGGLLLAVDGVGTADALPSTGYGRMLVAKLVLVGAAVFVAARSRGRVAALLAATRRPDGAAVARPVALLVGTEVGLMTLVLALTMFLVSWGPPG